MKTESTIDRDTLASLIEYAERYMAMNDEPSNGDCATVIAAAKRQLDDNKA